MKNKLLDLGNSLAVQRLGLGAFTAGGPGSNPGQGTKIKLLDLKFLGLAKLAFKCEGKMSQF